MLRQLIFSTARLPFYQKITANQPFIEASYKLSHSNYGTNTTPEETNLVEILQSKFPKASTIEVNDVSGGCGAMYEVWVESNEFKGLSRVKQHKLITQALKEQIKDMHGLRISTSIPES